MKKITVELDEDVYELIIENPKKPNGMDENEWVKKECENLITTKKYAEPLGLKKAKEYVSKKYNLPVLDIEEGPGGGGKGWDIKFRDKSNITHYVDVKCHKCPEKGFTINYAAKEKFDKFLKEKKSNCEVYLFLHESLKIKDLYIIPYEDARKVRDENSYVNFGKETWKKYRISNINS